MTSDRCCWPGCRNGYDILFAGKPLCDLHWERVSSENEKTRKFAYIKLKIPAEQNIGRMATDEESRFLCCYPGCNYPVSIIRDGKPLCNSHCTRDTSFEFDGVWKPHPAHTAVPQLKAELGAEKSKAESEPDEEEYDVSDFEKRLAAGAFEFTE